MFVVARWYFIKFNNMLVFSDPEPPIIKTPQVWVGIPDQFVNILYTYSKDWCLYKNIDWWGSERFCSPKF